MRYLINFSYDGTNFYGYQKQPNLRTVQEEIEKVLEKIYIEKIIINASGRTDAGVHALNQYAHFDIEKIVDVNKLKHSLNSLLPDDIYIKNIVKVDNDFHARYSVEEKEYIYKLNMAEYDPIERNYIYQYNKKLNIDEMKKGINLFIGKHNFHAFTKNNPKITDYEREIYDANIIENNSILTFKFRGNGFMQYQVRNMVGLLIEIGEGKRKYSEINDILKSQDRKKAGIMAPSCGLYLNKVKYFEKIYV